MKWVDRKIDREKKNLSYIPKNKPTPLHYHRWEGRGSLLLSRTLLVDWDQFWATSIKAVRRRKLSSRPRTAIPTGYDSLKIGSPKAISRVFHNFRFRSLRALHFWNFSNCCSHKCDLSISRVFQSYFWRLYAVWPNCASPFSTASKSFWRRSKAECRSIPRFWVKHYFI